MQWMQLKGRVVRSMRLVKQPKYFVGFLVGLGWMGLWVVRPLLASKLRFDSTPGTRFGTEFIPLIHQFAALVVTLAMPFLWLLPWGRLGLPFRESELTLLLQAPLSRRQVIQYGLLKSEVGVLLSGLLLPLFVGLGGPSARLLMGCGIWILFEFWHLNGKWRALFNLRQTEIPAGLARARRLALTIGLVGFYAALVFALQPFVVRIGAAFSGADYRQVTAKLTTVTWPPMLEALLTPAWWLTAPMFAGGAAAFAVAAAPMLLAILAQREIVLRSRARFEETALERATQEEAKKSPTRRFARISSRTRTKRPFELESEGRPEVALVWKNAMQVSRSRWLHVGSLGAALLVAIALLPVALPLNEVTSRVIAVFGVVVMVFPPLLTGMTWNNDLRTELAHVEIVRTWPVSAHRFVLAEVMSPAILSFACALFGAGVVLTSLLGSRLHETLSGRRFELVVLVVSALPMAAAVSFCSSALQNLATLFVPAWMAHSTDRNRGVAALGQRLLVSGALGLALVLAVLPGALLVGAAAGAQWLIGIPWSAWAFPFWGVLAAGPLFAMGWLMVQAAGRLWEQLDPSQEILELGR